MTNNAFLSWPFSQINPFLNYLDIECGLAPNTILAYRRDLLRFADYSLEHHWTQPGHLNPVTLQQYARYLSQNKFATTTIARHLVAVKMFFRYHLLVGLTDRDICAALETPKTWQRLPRVLSQSQTASLITALDPEDALYLRNRALLELLYATGIRASEAAHLRIADLNFQVAFLRCIGKGRKERIVPVNQTALWSVRQYLDELRPRLIRSDNGSDFIFLSRTGHPLSRVDVWRIVRHAALLTGLTAKITPHTLRHCFGSHLLQGGADLRYVQEMLGHADVTTTQIYTHVDQQHLRSMHKKFHPRP